MRFWRVPGIGSSGSPIRSSRQMRDQHRAGGYRGVGGRQWQSEAIQPRHDESLALSHAASPRAGRRISLAVRLTRANAVRGDWSSRLLPSTRRGSSASREPGSSRPARRARGPHPGETVHSWGKCNHGGYALRAPTCTQLNVPGWINCALVGYHPLRASGRPVRIPSERRRYKLQPFGIHVPFGRFLGQFRLRNNDAGSPEKPIRAWVLRSQ